MKSLKNVSLFPSFFEMQQQTSSNFFIYLQLEVHITRLILVYSISVICFFAFLFVCVCLFVFVFIDFFLETYISEYKLMLFSYLFCILVIQLLKYSIHV